MSRWDDAILKQSLCGKCLGCNKIETPEYRGTNNCLNFRDCKGEEDASRFNK